LTEGIPVEILLAGFVIVVILVIVHEIRSIQTYDKGVNLAIQKKIEQIEKKEKENRWVPASEVKEEDLAEENAGLVADDEEEESEALFS